MKIAIIPARSGSKGLPNKNIQCLGGEPLIRRAVRRACEAEIFDEIILSTDSGFYMNVWKFAHI